MYTSICISLAFFFLQVPIFDAQPAAEIYLECIFSMNNVAGFAKRHCLSDGTWGRMIGTNKTWVDYMSCRYVKEENLNKTSGTTPDNKKDVSANPPDRN